MTDIHEAAGTADASVTPELTGDLLAIGAQLHSAVRRDHQRHARRRRAVRTGAFVALGTASLTGTAFGAAALTGVVEVHRTVHTTTVPTTTVASTVAATASAGYRYGIDGRPVDSDTSPQLFVLSDHPLSPAAVAQLRDACERRDGALKGSATADESVWVRVSSCPAAQP